MNGFEQSVLYRPNIDTVNLKLDRKFYKRKKQIFCNSSTNYHSETINLKSHTNSKANANKNNYDQKSTLLMNKQKSIQQLQLPDIYLYSKPKEKEIIPITQKTKIMKELSKNLNFINKKISVINTDLFNLIKQPTKPIHYDSDIYKDQLALINEIFFQCGINLRSRDILTLQGRQSQTRYSLFTNYPKHPQSLCCFSEVVIKHVQFVSPQRYNFYGNRDIQNNLKSIVTINCLKCDKDIVKILPFKNNQGQQQQSVSRSKFQQQKRLINFSKLISSGRFKKHLINDQSVDLMQSRNVSLLGRSKTSLNKLKQNSQTLRLKHSQSKRYQRQNRVKSQQMSLQLKQKSQQINLQLKQKYQNSNTQELIKKRQKIPILKFFKQID